MFTREFHSHLHTLHLYFGTGHVLMNFLNSNNEVIDLKQTHNLVRDLLEEVKQQRKVNLQINDKTINAIATSSKEIGQLITETLRKEKQTLSNNKNHKKQTEKKKLTLKHSGETLSIQERKHSGNITKLKEPMTGFQTC